MTPSEFVKVLEEERAVAILRTDDQQVAREAMAAAVRGGFRLLEFTLAVPGVYGLIEEFAARDDLVVGAGTVLRPEDARAAVEAGARFIVSPVVDEEVIAEALSLGVAVMPGTHTATEMLRAHRAGAPLQKLFPAPAGGPSYVRSVLGPLPFLRIVPTSGVDADNVGEWFAAGVYAVGLVRPLFDPRELEARDYEAIEERARRLREAVLAAPRPRRTEAPDLAPR